MNDLSPDGTTVWEWGPVTINATIAFTWVVMAAVGIAVWWIGRRLTAGPEPPRAQVVAETVVDAMRRQITEIAPRDPPDRYLGFVGTLFVFIAVSNILAIVPGFVPPTASLSTTAALAGCVLLAVPAYGIARRGARAYLGSYLEPTVIMLPFNVIGELSRTLALAVRLFGNMMSGTMVVTILLAIVPFLLPVVFRALGLLTGLVQAYLFAILAMVYIAAGTQADRKTPQPREDLNG